MNNLHTDNCYVVANLYTKSPSVDVSLFTDELEALNKALVLNAKVIDDEAHFEPLPLAYYIAVSRGDYNNAEYPMMSAYNDYHKD